MARVGTPDLLWAEGIVRDAAPRAMLECMAADVPVLVNAEMQAGLRYVALKSGLVVSPAQFHEGIAEILDHPDRFRHREWLTQRYSRQAVVDKFWATLSDVIRHKKAIDPGE